MRHDEMAKARDTNFKGRLSTLDQHFLRQRVSKNTSHKPPVAQTVNVLQS